MKFLSFVRNNFEENGQLENAKKTPMHIVFCAHYHGMNRQLMSTRTTFNNNKMDEVYN